MAPHTSQCKKNLAIRSPIGRLLLSSMQASATYMSTVQSIMGRLVPGVFYPQEDSHRDTSTLRDSGTNLKLFQPTDHVARLLGVNTLEDLHAETARRGYDGYCFPTFHERRLFGKENPGLVSDTANSLEELAKKTKAVHIELNRVDFAAQEPHIPTRAELEAALQGNFNGELGEILTVVKELGNVGYIVIESVMGGLKKVTGHKKIKDLQKDYQVIGDSARAFFNSA
jgi:hypothetical protein